MAKVFVACAQPEGALEALEQALALGASGERLANDPELAALRSQAGFVKLVGTQPLQ